MLNHCCSLLNYNNIQTRGSVKHYICKLCIGPFYAEVLSLSECASIYQVTQLNVVYVLQG